ncbi:retrotransposon protein, putative, ty1-copia subclass [Tanacetum coccineum]
MVLRVKKKLFVTEQPISPAPPTDSKYLRSGMRFMILTMRLLVLRSKELKSMFEKQAGVERFDPIQTFHASKQKEGKPFGPYVINMKNYVVQLERLGYVLPRDLSVSLIMNGLTSDFAGFAATPQVMAIQGGRIQKSNKKSFNAKGKGKGKGRGKDKSYISKPKNPKPSAKEHPAQDDICHYCKEVGHCKKNCLAYLAELIKKKKQVGTASSSNIFFTLPYTPQLSGVFERRNRTLLDIVRSMMNPITLPLSFWDYALESAAHILNIVPTKKVDKTPYELWYGKVPNLSYLKVWGCEALVKRYTPDKLQQRSVNGRAGKLKEIQDEDTSPSKITSEIPMEVEEVEEHSLGDLNEPVNYKAALLDPKSDKWLDAMNAEMQSIKDNQVWRLVDLPPNCKTVGRKWLFKKKTDMDGNVHTYKDRLVANGFTQTFGVDYKETFSPVADIRAIRILIAITTFYDYEI